MEHRVRTGSADPRKAVQQAYAYISLAQDEPLAQVAAGALVAFAAVCQRLGIAPSDGYERGAALLRNGDIAREVQALYNTLDYLAQSELGGVTKEKAKQALAAKIAGVA